MLANNPIFPIDSVGHCKNLLLQDKKKNLFLVCCLEDTKVDMKEMAKIPEIGAKNKLMFASPATLLASLGTIPGAVSPFCLMHKGEKQVLKVVLGSKMMAKDSIAFHPGTNCATTAITPAGLAKFVAATKHEFVVVDV